MATLGGGETLALAALAARTSGANGTTFSGLGSWSRALVLLAVSDASLHEAGDTLDVYVDCSPDGGTTWINAIHFTQRAGDATGAKKEWAVLATAAPAATVTDVSSDAASAAVRAYVLGNAMRARWAIADSGDGDSSHTFSVTAYLM
jgi:hypothetical protein